MVNTTQVRVWPETKLQAESKFREWSYKLDRELTTSENMFLMFDVLKSLELRGIDTIPNAETIIRLAEARIRNSKKKQHEKEIKASVNCVI